MALNEVKKGEPSSDAAHPLDEGRRDALRRVARFGAYTAPALLVMLASEKAAHADSVR
jgi:hypothetical protein